jgi:hypothetical protein
VVLRDMRVFVRVWIDACRYGDGIPNMSLTSCVTRFLECLARRVAHCSCKMLTVNWIYVQTVKCFPNTTSPTFLG